MSNLKDELIKLGSAQPELREHLRPILDSLSKEATYGSFLPASIVQDMVRSVLGSPLGRKVDLYIEQRDVIQYAEGFSKANWETLYLQGKKAIPTDQGTYLLVVVSIGVANDLEVDYSIHESSDPNIKDAFELPASATIAGGGTGPMENPDRGSIKRALRLLDECLKKLK